MRIGIVTVSFLPRLGGAVTQTLLLYEYLRRNGHHVEVFCPDLQRAGQFEENGIIVNRIASPLIRDFEGMISRLAIVRGFRRVAQRRRADFDVFITPEFNIGPLSLCLASGVRRVGIYGADLTFEFLNYRRERIIPYGAVLRNRLREIGPSAWLWTSLLNALQRFMFQRLDHVIALNPEDLRRIGRHTAAVSKIGCLMNIGNPGSALAAKPRTQPRIATIIGRAVSWKRIPENFAAARRLREQFPELEVHYFGTGPFLERYEAEYGREVQFHRNLPNAQVLEWLERSDVTINLSEYETFCLTNTEAMLKRSLLLVKPLAEYADYLTPGRNCIAVQAPEEPTWLAAVTDAFNRGSARQIVDEAEQTIRKNYSLDRIGPEIESLLERVQHRA